MSHKRYAIPKPKPSCWNCAKLRKSKSKMEISDGRIMFVGAPSILDAMSSYYCQYYWWSNKPYEDEMLCKGKHYKSVFK